MDNEWVWTQLSSARSAVYIPWYTSFLPEDGHKDKSQPSARRECAGCTKTTDLHHHKERSSGVEKN